MNNKCWYCLPFLLLFANLLYGQQGNDEMISYWHKTLARQLRVSPQAFRLSQGSSTVLRSSDWMWNIFDAVTADTSAYYYNPDQHNSFSAYYGLLLFRAGAITFSKQPMADSCQLNAAILRYAAANNKYVWDKTIDQLFTKLPLTTGLHFTADTVIQTITTGVQRPAIITPAITRVNVSITCDFGRTLIFYSVPYEIADPNNPALYNYKPWFSTCVFKTLISQSLFKQSVSKPALQACTALVVADSIAVTLRLRSFSKTALLQIAHYLPINPDGLIKSTVVNNQIIYTLTANTSSPARNPILIGVLLMPISVL